MFTSSMTYGKHPHYQTANDKHREEGREHMRKVMKKLMKKPRNHKITYARVLPSLKVAA